MVSKRDRLSVDWTFAEAPEVDEPASPEARGPSQKPWTLSPPLAGPHRPVRRNWLLPCAALAALALTVGFPHLEAWHTRWSVQAAIAQQEQARQAGDWGAFRSSLLDPTGAWADQQVQRLSSGWQASAFDLPGARLDSQAGWVSQYQALSPQLVRAEVVRTFVLADGARAAFAQSQFYQFGGGAWRQVPAPPTPASDQEALHGARVDVLFNPADAEMAASVDGDLEKLLGRACADWDCPADLRVAVVFAAPALVAPARPLPIGQWSGSLTFQLLVAGPYPLPGLVVMLPTREWGAYPADGAAVRAVQRVVAVEALANIAERLSGGAPGIAGPIRPVLYALIVRELARLGIEAPSLAEVQTASRVNEPEQLWSLRTLDVDSQPALPAALAMLNRLLAGRAVTDEQRLLHALGQASDPVVWLADGLGLTQAEAQAQWAALLNPP